MATSPNYGWLEPDNTDLVKNGALAIRTLGNAIDTTMATMTPKSTVTTKGDLVAATAASTPARLAVGNNGETLVADSSTTTGLRWQGSYTAGKNRILNGSMDIAQRGTSISVGSASYTYTLDRWKCYSGNSATTVSQNTSAPTGFNYSLKLQRPNANTGTNALSIVQIIESANVVQLQGQTATISFYLKKGANYSGGNISIQVLSGTVADQGGDPYSWTGLTVPINDSSYSPTTSFVRLPYSGTIPSGAKELAVAISYTPTGTAGADDAIYITGVQLEAGAVTSYQTATGTIQGELAACQRYYTLWASGNSQPIGMGTYLNTTQVNGSISLPVEMRTTPTISIVTGTDYYKASSGGGGTDTLNSLTLDTCSTRAIRFYNASEAAGTSGQAAVLTTNNAAAFLAFQAEL